MGLLLALGLVACGDDEDSERAIVVTGVFEIIDQAPPGTGGLSGRGELTVSGDGTVAQIDLEGLEPNTDYVALVHTERCDEQTPGGEPLETESGEMIRLELTSDGNGLARSTTSVGSQVSDPGSRSMIVGRSDSTEIACAEFS